MSDVEKARRERALAWVQAALTDQEVLDDEWAGELQDLLPRTDDLLRGYVAGDRAREAEIAARDATIRERDAEIERLREAVFMMVLECRRPWHDSITAAFKRGFLDHPAVAKVEREHEEEANRGRAVVDVRNDEKKIDDAMRFCAVRKWKDGGKQVVEFFRTQQGALVFIQRQPQPVEDEFVWCVGEFDASRED